MNSASLSLDFSECASENLGKTLYNLLQDGHLFDEVGNQVYGWHALVVYKRIPYILSISRNGKVTYKDYGTNHAAKKAWDHICNKFEKWYTERNKGE